MEAASRGVLPLAMGPPPLERRREGEGGDNGHPTVTSSSSSSSSSSGSTSSLTAAAGPAPTAVLVNLPSALAPLPLSPWSALSPLLATPLYPASLSSASSPPSSSLALLPPSLVSLRALVCQVLLLRCELMEIFERWSQLSKVDPAQMPPSMPSPLLKKLHEKQMALEHAMMQMRELQRGVGLDRLERGKRSRRAKSIMGYEAFDTPHSTAIITTGKAAAAAGGAAVNADDGGDGLREGGDDVSDDGADSNEAVTRRMRTVHQHTREVRKELSRGLLALFPALHSSLTSSPPPSSSSSPSSPSLDSVLSTALRLCNALHGGGRSPAWRGLQLQKVLDVDGERVVGLIVSLPLLMRVVLSLDGGGRAGGGGAGSSGSTAPSVRSLSVLGWSEALLSSPAQRSRHSVFLLVHAQLLARLVQLQTQLSAFPQPSVSPQPFSSSSRAASASVVLLPASPLLQWLLFVSSYHSLLSSPCRCCHRLLVWGGGGVGFVPPVVRTADGLSLHLECCEGWRRGLPQLHSAGASSSNSSISGSRDGSSSSSSSASVAAAVLLSASKVERRAG